MDIIKKQSIVNSLREYCERYESQNKAAASMKGVSAATVSQMLNGKWDLIKNEMWRNVAAQTGHKDTQWAAVETTNFRMFTKILDDARLDHKVMAVTADAGSGKTFTAKHYTRSNKQVYLLMCNEYWNRKLFLQELLMAMGREYSGYTVGEMMNEAVRGLKMQESPLVILDEADKLSDQVLYFFITLYNQLEDECGIVMCATSHLEKRLRRGVALNKKGYNEIWSRINRRCIPLRGVSAADIVAICEANDITDKRMVDNIIADSDSDLRRVKQKVYAAGKRKTR